MAKQLPILRPMERRGRRRTPCRAPVRVSVSADDFADSFVLESSDLSSDGVFLHTDLLFSVGEWLELEFVVPGRVQPVRGRGRVVRVDGTSGPPGPGVAVHIPGLSEEERAALGRMGGASTRRGP